MFDTKLFRNAKKYDDRNETDETKNNLNGRQIHYDIFLFFF